MLWAVATGVFFTILNVILRKLTLEMSPYEVQFLRYLIGIAVMLPWILAAGFAAYRPNGLGGQLWRGADTRFCLRRTSSRSGRERVTGLRAGVLS